MINAVPTEPLTCFKAYDVRGEIGVNFGPEIAYRIGRAVGQHFGSGAVVLGHDARETSPDLPHDEPSLSTVEQSQAARTSRRTGGLAED